MKKLRVLWDMDGCHTQLCPPVIQHLNQLFPELNWSVEDILVWNFSDDPEISKAAFDFMNTPGFFRGLLPYSGSVEAYQEIVSLGHDVIICTTPLSGEHRERCMQEKIDWLIEHIGESALTNIMFSDNKSELEADVIIDDQPHLTAGKTNIQFKHWLIVDHPYNRILPKLEHAPVGRINNNWSNYKEEFAKVGLI